MRNKFVSAGSITSSENKPTITFITQPADGSDSTVVKINAKDFIKDQINQP